MALAIYRKYRPRTFEDLSGQEMISRILKNAASQNKFSHAYLFAGPRGSGKTSTARLIAKVANCLTRLNDAEFAKLGEPCNHCRVCDEVDQGQALDVIEIDAASNRGIDEIRNLRESVRLSPTSFRKKIFIIDECLTADHFVSLADGRVKKINELKNGDEILSIDLNTGLPVKQKVSNWFSRQAKELIYIRTPQTTLKCTSSHRLWVMRNGIFTLIQVKDLQISDFLLSPTLIPHITKNSLRPAQLAFLALIQCDGHVSKDSSTIQVEISKDVDYFISQFKKGIKAWQCPEENLSLKKTKRGTTLLRFYSLELKKELINLHCPAGKKSNIIDIPDEVFQAPLESIRAFIDTCFCCEGDATFTPQTRLYKLSFNSTSEIFVKKLQLLLKKFGIASSFMEISRRNKKHHPSYRLNITGYDLRLFQQNIGLSLERKANILKGQLGYKEKQDSIPIQSAFLQFRKELSIPHSVLNVGGVYLDKTQGLTRQSAQEFIKIAKAPQFKSYLQFRYEKILDIKYKKRETTVYDFTVENTHTFIANGICSSNCHMLTKEAFNALLKTLEEPPEHVILILATTEFEKIPPTIISRTQQFHFKRIPLIQIKDKLKKIAESEKLEISNEALELIAASAEGSFRDAESLLDQLMSFGYQKIEVNEVEKMIGKVTFSKIADFSETLLKGQIDKALKCLAEIEDDGYNLAQFNKDLIHYLRKVLVLKFEPSLENAFREELTPEALEKIKSHSQLVKEEHLELLKALIKAYSQMRYSQFPIIPLEVAIVENLKTEKLKN